jgi:uncharacterized protein (DUF2461 family)
MNAPSFPPGGHAWFEDLREHMDKSWYDAHKADYKRLWHEPMRAVLSACALGLAPRYGAPLAAPKVHRIHNDRRFRAGAPYKTHCAGYVGFDAPAEGVMASAVPLHLSYGDQQHVGGGVPMFADADTLARWRAAVADPTTGAELEALLAEAAAAGIRYHAFSALKQGPAGLRDHPRVGLLKLKGLILTADPPPPTAPDLVERLIRVGEAMAPTVRWLAHHVTGPADA